MRHSSNNQLKIAFCGTRGVPANYGGFETAVDKITKHFIAKGYICEVFCRRSTGVTPFESHEGRHLVHVLGSSLCKLDTFMSSIQTGWYLWRHRKRYRYVFWFNNANFLGIVMTLLVGIPMSVNTDGLEWRREKWSLPFKAYYFISSFLIARLCKSIISDSVAIQSYYQKHFFKKTIFIPYGYPNSKIISEEKQRMILEQYNLQKNRYFLQITRFEPDNLPLKIAVAFGESRLWEKQFKLVLIGYKDETKYSSRIKSLSGMSGIEVLNALYDEDVLAVLRSNCFCYVHGNSVGGTNPALLEAMANCPRIMAIDGPFNREVLVQQGIFFKSDDIVSAFKLAISVDDKSLILRDLVSENYQWDEVANSYVMVVEGKTANYMPRRNIAPK